MQENTNRRNIKILLQFCKMDGLKSKHETVKSSLVIRNQKPETEKIFFLIKYPLEKGWF
jgi:hypothetical protein